MEKKRERGFVSREYRILRFDILRTVLSSSVKFRSTLKTLGCQSVGSALERVLSDRNLLYLLAVDVSGKSMLI